MLDRSNELRLALLLLLNAAAFVGALRFACRRGGGGMLQAACDAFLVYFVIQYVAVALPGALGVFNLWTMSFVALAASMLLWIGGGKPLEPLPFSRRACPPWTADHFVLLGCFTFLATYLLAHAIDQRENPPTATDALVYHIPTAVQWIQTGQLGYFGTWYWNPAATYSPATSSTFMAWLMLPLRNDVFVRFVQCPPLLFIFVLAARLCREFGCSRAVAGLIALAAAMSRPLLSEAIIPKDDLFITAFFGAAVLAFAPSNLQHRLGPWRVGVALGMTLACKYTVLIVCPLFLFLIDAPFRAKWRLRDWLIAAGVALVLFVPWYARNIVLTGNPLFPVDVKLFGRVVFEGLFGTEPDQQLRTAGGVWKMLNDTYHSLPDALIWILAVLWIAGIVATKRLTLRSPLHRACMIGSAVTITLFIVTSPHHELRYMYPLLPLLFGVAGAAIVGWLKQEPARIGVAAVVAVVSLATAFDGGLATRVTALLGQALIATTILLAAALAASVFKNGPKLVGLTATTVSLLLLCGAYVYWGVFLGAYYLKTNEGYGPAGISYAWYATYPAEEPLWTFVRENLPDDATIAIANTYFVYPFQDTAYHRRLVYAPVLKGLHDFRSFPRMGDTVPGDVIVQRMTDVQNEQPDKPTWLENLRRSGAEYVVVATFPHDADPPERRFVAEEPGLFEKLYDHPQAGSVYRLRREMLPSTAPASPS